MSPLLRGYLLLAASLSLLAVALSVVLLKLLPSFEQQTHPWFHALQSDEYYVLLMPLMLPVAIVFVYANWMGMKLYRHN
jgi:phosphatidylinositol glycan anchor class Y biosynthesis protein